MYLPINNYYSNTFLQENEETDLYFVEVNKYIPVQSWLSDGGVRTLEDFLYYHPNSFSSYANLSNTIRQIKHSLFYTNVMNRIVLNKATNFSIFICKGGIFTSKYVPLLLYVYSKEDLLKIQLESDYDKNQILKQECQKILVSSELLTNSKYSSFYRRIHKEILLSAYEKGIEVITLTSENIQKNAFKKVLENSFTFSSISVLERYLKEEVPNFLLLSYEEMKTIEDYETVIQDLPVLEDNTEISFENLPIEEEALLYGGWEEDMEIEANETEAYIEPDWDGILSDDYLVRAIDPIVETSSEVIINPITSIPYTPIRQRGEPTILLVDD